jgi:hypothetical protein
MVLMYFPDIGAKLDLLTKIKTNTTITIFSGKTHEQKHFYT